SRSPTAPSGPARPGSGSTSASATPRPITGSPTSKWKPTTTDMLDVDEFERIFESVKNWDRWGPDDELGTLNYITPEKVTAAAQLVTSGRKVSMAIPINTVAGPDNQQPAIHFVSQSHDVPVDGSKVRFALDFLGMSCHGDCHTHM